LVPEPGSDLIFRLARLFETIETKIAIVTPLLANHDPAETCLIYYIEKDGKKLLYGTIPDGFRSKLGHD
jgi:phosphoribosyl 1,2-cyclic phosphate phosphodiesterase